MVGRFKFATWALAPNLWTGQQQSPSDPTPKWFYLGLAEQSDLPTIHICGWWSFFTSLDDSVKIGSGRVSLIYGTQVVDRDKHSRGYRGGAWVSRADKIGATWRVNPAQRAEEEGACMSRERDWPDAVVLVEVWITVSFQETQVPTQSLQRANTRQRPWQCP